MAFIGLHNHTDYSNFKGRDSINKTEDLINYAHSLGHKGIAITEHDTIASSLEVLKIHEKNKNKEEWKDWKTLLGNEIYLCNSDTNAENKDKDLVFPHFLLIALNAEGHKQIRELSTRAWQRSFKRFVMRVPTHYEDLFEIIGNNPGNVVGCSACLGGSLPSKLLEFRETNDPQTWQECVQWATVMSELFGRGKFFLELQPSNNEEQIYVNKKLVELSQLTGIDYIITTDSHYLKKEDRPIHKAFLESQDSDREVDSFYETTYVMSEEEIHEYMDDILGFETVELGINNTMKIYDMAEEYVLRKPLEIPYIPINIDEPSRELFIKYAPLIEHLDAFYYSEHACDRHLVREIVNAIESDEQYQTQETYDAVADNLNSIEITSQKNSVRWSAYLLQLEEVIEIIWDEGDSIIGAGRGSGVGFLLLNTLDITQINPLREEVKTYPWRSTLQAS